MLYIDPKTVLKKASKQLRMAELRRSTAAFLPEVSRQCRAVEVVLAVRHESGQEPRKIRRVEVVLRKQRPVVLTGESSRSARQEEAVLPKRVLASGRMNLFERRGLVRRVARP